MNNYSIYKNSGTVWRLTYEDGSHRVIWTPYLTEDKYTDKVYTYLNEAYISKVEDLTTHVVYEATVPETEEEARERAIQWQTDFDNHNYSYEECMYWSDYFEGLAHKFPNLRDEFRETCIIP